MIMVSKDEKPVSHFSQDEMSLRAGHKRRIAHLLEEMISQEENEHLPRGEKVGLCWVSVWPWS